jgi:hypothetical protein
MRLERVSLNPHDFPDPQYVSEKQMPGKRIEHGYYLNNDLPAAFIASAGASLLNGRRIRCERVGLSVNHLASSLFHGLSSTLTDSWLEIPPSRSSSPMRSTCGAFL